MKLSTLELTDDLNLIAERFVKSDDTVYLSLSLIKGDCCILSHKGYVCAIGISNIAKDMRYFKHIRQAINAIASEFVSQIEAHPDLKGLFIDEDTIITFILGGIFDSY